MKKCFLFLIISGFIIFLGCDMVDKTDIDAIDMKGRYQIKVAGEGRIIYVLDTSTGMIWEKFISKYESDWKYWDLPKQQKYKKENASLGDLNEYDSKTKKNNTESNNEKKYNLFPE